MRQSINQSISLFQAQMKATKLLKRRREKKLKKHTVQ